MTPLSKQEKINSILQLAVSGLGLLFLLAAAAGSGIFSLLTGDSMGRAVSGALDLFLPALLLLPAVTYSARRLLGSDAGCAGVNPPWWISLLLLAWPPLLLASAAVLRADEAVLEAGDPLLPLFSLTRFLTMLTLTAWASGLAAFHLPVMTPRRGWGLLSAGMLGGTLLAGLLEALLVTALVVVGVLVMLLVPSLAERLLALLETAAAQTDPSAVLQMLQPLLNSPLVIGLAFLLISLAVPLIEEAVKPAALWLLKKEKLSPAQGFLGGLMCGAGFGLAENLMSTNPLLGGDWLLVAVMRAGTTLLHMLASGLVGLGLARWWSGGGFKHAAGGYLLAVGLHGAWNGLTLALGLTLLQSGDLSPAAYAILGGMGLLTLACLGLLLRVNRDLRRAVPPVSSENML
jgi:RsiW-degrading membrane proteinase PrsW (M82 family)